MSRVAVHFAFLLLVGMFSAYPDELPDREQVTKARILGLRIESILKRYVAVDDYIAEFDLRRVIPVPGVFRAIDFEGSIAKLDGVSKDLAATIEEVDRQGRLSSHAPTKAFLKALGSYSSRVRSAASTLRGMLAKLLMLANGKKEYTVPEYMADFEKYKSTVEAYTVEGGPLTEAFIRMNQR